MAKNVIEITIKASDNASASIGKVGDAFADTAAKIEAAAQKIAQGGAAYDENTAKSNKLRLATLELAKTQVELTTETDALKRAQLQVRADALTKQINDLNKATDKSTESTGKATDGFAKFMNVLKGVGALAIAKKIFDISLELGNLALQADSAKARFEAFAGGAQKAAEILRAVKSATGGTISEVDAMAASTKLLSMSLATSADEVAKITTMAIRLGDQTQAAGDRVADFAALLANQSTPRLDNFGISSGKVRERIAELQTAMPGLSREAAFMQATMEIGAQSLDKLDTSMGSATIAAQQGKAATADFKVELGRYVSGTVMAGQATSGNLIRNLTDLMIAMRETKTNTTNLGAGIQLLSVIFTGSSKAIREMKMASEAAAKGTAALVQGYSDVGASAQGAADKMAAYTGAQDAANTAAANAKSAFSDAASALGELSMAQFAAAQIDALRVSLEGVEGGAEKFAIAQEAILIQFGLLSKDEQRAQSAIDSLMRSFIAGTLGPDEFSRALSDVKSGLDAIQDRKIVVDFEWNLPPMPDLGGGGGNRATPKPEQYASGVEGIFTTPTHAVFGEAGPEYVYIRPLSGRGGAGTTNYNNNSQIGGDTIIINNAAQGAQVMERRARLRATAGGF